MKNLLKSIAVGLLILGVFFLLSCRPAPSTDTLTMTRKATAAEVDTVFTNSIYLMGSLMQADQNYLIPKKAWVSEVFRYQVDDFLTKNKVTISLDASDCNKLADYGKTVANLYYDHGNHKKFVDGNLACGILVFMYWDMRVHVVNFLVVENEKGKLEIVIYDPSVHKVIPYDNEENTGIWGWM